MDLDPTPSTSSTAERPWTLAEAAAFLREHERTTRRRVERGDLRPHRLPGSRRLLFDPSEIKGLLQESTSTSEACEAINAKLVKAEEDK